MVTEMPYSEAFTPGWKEGLYSESEKGLVWIPRSIAWVGPQWAVLNYLALLEGQWKPQRIFCQGKVETLLEPYSSLGLVLGQEAWVWLLVFKPIPIFFFNKGHKSNCYFSEIKWVERVFPFLQSSKGQIGICLGQGKSRSRATGSCDY